MKTAHVAHVHVTNIYVDTREKLNQETQHENTETFSKPTFLQSLICLSKQHTPSRFWLTGWSEQELAGDFEDGPKNMPRQSQHRQPQSEPSQRRSVILWLPSPVQGNQN